MQVDGPALDPARERGQLGVSEPVTERSNVVRSGDGHDLRKAGSAGLLAEPELRHLFESGAMGVAVLDHKGRLLYANGSLRDMFGVGDEPVGGMGDDAVACLESVAREPELFEQVLSGRIGSYRIGKRLARRGGTPLFADVVVSGLRAASNGDRNVVAMVVDLTSRHELEDALSAEKAVTESLIASAPGLLYMTSIDGTFVRWNSAVEELLGLSAGEMTSADASTFICEEDVEAGGVFGARLIGEGSADAEIRIRTVDGPRDFLITGRRVDVGGEPYLVGSGVDITERRLVERELARAREGLEAEVGLRTAELRLSNESLQSEVERSARIQADVERVARAHHTLSAVNRALVRETEEQDLVQAVCDAIVEVGGYRLAWVGYCVADAEHSVAPVAFAGAEEGYLGSINVSWDSGVNGTGPVSRAITGEEPVVVRDIASDPSCDLWRERALGHGYRSVIGLPLLSQDGTIEGAMGIYSDAIDAFDEDETSLLRELADDLAFGILHRRTQVRREESEADLKQSYQRLERMTRGVVEAMGKAIEARDPYTSGHQDRVAHLCVLLANEMGLPPDEVAAVEVAALLHDIGKLTVPSEILSNPGQLRPLEYEIIKAHARRGYEILKDIEFPWPVAEIVLQHHERLDGSGYPAGLTSEGILLPARILGVADVVEAMASHRPYRPALGLDAAIEEIRDHPALFDADVVAACVRLHELGRIDLRP